MTATIATAPQFCRPQVKGSKVYWRFRRGTIDAKIPGQPGEPAFIAEYLRLLDLSNEAKAAKPAAPLAIDASDTFSWLMKRYQRSAEFDCLAPASKIAYLNMMKVVEPELGHHPYKLISAAMIKAVRDRVFIEERKKGKAHKVKQIVSLLYVWAQAELLVELGWNPARPIKRLNGKVNSYRCWSEEEIELFFEHCPAWLKLPVMLALYTGQRLSDVAIMEWTQVQKGTIRVRQEKTDELLDIAIHRELKAVLDQIDIRQGNICRTLSGKAIGKDNLGKHVKRQLLKTPGFPPARSFHGLRYAAAARLEEAGCTLVQITSVTGHRAASLGMQYASQRRENQAAIARQEAYEAGQKGQALA